MKASARTNHLRDSQIRQTSALRASVGGVNLAQDFPDFPAPVDISGAVRTATSTPSWRPADHTPR
ncbi:MAG: hypothetical protein ACRCYX_05245 [Dermatophilaceae bacterium]